MAMNIRKHRELCSTALQSGRRGTGRFVDVVAKLAEPTSFLSTAASRPAADVKVPYTGNLWFSHAMNQRALRTGRSAA